MTTVLTVYNPYTQESLDSLKMQSRDEVVGALDRAYQLFGNRNVWLSKSRRYEILQTAAQLVRDRRNSLALAATQEGGKPLSDSLVEIDRAAEGIVLAAQGIWQLSGEEIPMGLNPASENRIAVTQIEPRGVVLAISAFNHPFNLIVHQAVTAVAAGCPVIVKPALSTPISCQNLLEILYEAGLPRDWAQMILCSDEDTEHLVTDSRVALLNFIGSARVGWHLRRVLAPGATCLLEHGGVAPVIVDKYADLSKVVPALTKSGFYHAGQVCVSTQRIYVHEALMADFLELFKVSVNALSVGDPSLPETAVGPLISTKEVARIHNWVEEAIKEGANCLVGGELHSETSYLPTVLVDPSDSSLVSTQEIFGPVTCVYGFSELSEAVERANAVPLRFQAAVFSQDIDRAMLCMRTLKAQAVMVNDHTAFRVDWMPFGGAETSGLGVGGILQTMREMSLEKLCVIHSPGLEL